jgi:Cys-tRNA synthase (O-phospho-L-seryl-tRNA:Cys-tRNA synthase)
LYDLKGKSVVSDTLTEYTGYIKAGKIKRLLNPVNVADVPNRKASNP